MLAHQEKLKICGHKIPHYFWFMLSGGICDILQAFIDYAISIVYVLKWEKPTVCWTCSYIMSIMIRHYSHRILVFGEYEGSYCSSITRCYATYSSSIVMSLIMNHVIVTYFYFTHIQAWVITMLWTGIFNYFMLKATWRKDSKGVSATKEKDSDIVVSKDEV
mmetsp:Transcript_3247/g.4632  ORF Transcript_3247/g.4632 Transcript_3247/m.4632 type:complete len:162 (+) Transcript_3247:51-536(+)